MIKYFIVTFYLLSCASSKKSIDGYDLVRFKEKIFSESKSVIQDYLLDVPKSGELKKINTGDSFIEYRVQYKDSSVIYILNDGLSGSRLNYENRYNNNIKAVNRKSNYDTLTFGGTQKNGNYWKESFLGEIVIGYANAKPTKKEEFEKSLLTLRKKK